MTMMKAVNCTPEIQYFKITILTYVRLELHVWKQYNHLQLQGQKDH